MKKIKYQGGITKLLMSRVGNKNKKRFANLSKTDLQALVKQFGSKPVTMEVVSLSSSRDFPEQLLSILSYQRFVGTPISWTICSDGSHTEEQIATLSAVFPFVKLSKIDFTDREKARESMKERNLSHFDQMLHYAQTAPMGKKLFYYMNYKITNPTLFLDSDILFYKLASIAFNQIKSDNVSGWYLPDHVWGCLDTRYKAVNTPQMYQINAGFFLLNKELENIQPGLDFLDSLDKKYEYFSEQNTFHILLRENKCFPFDPRTFILNSDDQFDFAYGFNRNAMAIRHYTGPVRHKMWQQDWKWQLSLEDLG